MPAITRKTATIFASNAGVDQIAEFGSLAANTPTFTTDPAVIQSLSNYTTGWFGAVIGSNSPAIEDMNALCYVFSYQIAYLLQAGIAAWDSGTTYFAGNFVSDGNGNIYYSLTNSNLNNAVTTVADWKLYNSVMPAWSSAVSYSSGNFVSYSNSLYYSLINSNLNNTPSTSPSDWQLFVPSSFGNYVNIIEPTEQRSEQEHFGIVTDPFDNSISTGFYNLPGNYHNQGILLQSQTGTTGSIVWSPVVLNSAAKDTTTTTNWTVVANAITLTTSATAQVGAASVSFTKNASGLASIKYDYGSLGVNVPNNTRLWFWINLANLTSFQNVNVIVSADATTFGTNYETWTLTTNSAGGALTTGWNLCFVNLAVAGTPTGTGWNSTIPFRFFSVGINTTSAASTVVLVNGIYFSLSQPQQNTPAGSELTVFDGTHTENYQIDTSNTTVDGPVTLTNTLANTYAGGFAGASVYRSILTIGNNQAIMGSLDPNGNSLAGAITLSQNVRLTRILRTALNNNTLSASATVVTSQVYSISSTTTNVIVVNDSVNQTANLLSGDVVHVFSTSFANGVPTHIYLGDFTLTSNSTASGGLTTLTGTGGVPIGTAAGGYVVKKNLTASLSTTTTSANESFNTLSPVNSPDGIILMRNGFSIPNSPNVIALYSLSGPQGSNNSFVNNSPVGSGTLGTAPNMIVNGTLTSTNAFKNGQMATSGWSSSNYLSLVNGTDLMFDAQSQLFASFWIYPTNFNSANRFIMGRWSSNLGWKIGYNGTSFPGSINLTTNGTDNITSTNGPGFLTLNTWNHVVCQWNSPVSSGSTPANAQIWINGVLSYEFSATISSSGSAPFQIGFLSTFNVVANDQFAQILIGTGTTLSPYQVSQVYNNGLSQLLGVGSQLKYRYQATGLAGQKMTYKLGMVTDTIAVLPLLTDMQIIKTG